MKISRGEAEYIANLARLAITDQEKAVFADQLTQIFDHIAKLNELDTEGIPTTSHVLPIQNVFREDEICKQTLGQSLLENAPITEHKHYKVPKIIE